MVQAGKAAVPAAGGDESILCTGTVVSAVAEIAAIFAIGY